MDLGHVLSWGSPISSVASLECYSSRKESGQWQLWAGNLRRGGRERGSSSSSSAVSLTVVCRSSNGESRRTTGYNSSSSSSSGRGSNALSSRPRGPREQSNDSSSGNVNSEGSRESYGRQSGGSDGSGKNASRNSRGSEGRYGSGRGYGGGGGGYQGRGDRRDRESKMHPGAYKMRDEQTGDLVVVWGVEDDDDIPMPTADDLNWKKSTMARAGDISEQAWARVLEQQTGSSGSYMVRGVEPKGKDWTDLFEVDSEDDDEDEDDFSDEDYSDSDAEELTENIPKVAISRARRLKVFGRDLWGKSQPKVKMSENNDTYFTSEPDVKSETMPFSDTVQAAVVENQDFSAGVIAIPSDYLDGKNRVDEKRANKEGEQLGGTALENEDSLSVERRASNDDDLDLKKSAASKSGENLAERSRALKSDKGSRETSRVAKIEEKSSERSRTPKSPMNLPKSMTGLQRGEARAPKLPQICL